MIGQDAHRDIAEDRTRRFLQIAYLLVELLQGRIGFRTERTAVMLEVIERPPDGQS